MAVPQALDASNWSPPIEVARAAGLRYVSDATPGIRRVKRGRGFTYIGPDTDVVRDERTLARIRSLVIPPAWTDVWICPSERGHIQVTGFDNRGRKQYRYHDRWRIVRDAAKYDRLTEFGKALPSIRARVAEDLKRPGLPRERVLATIVELLDQTRIRVGGELYARENKSFGLTTFRNRHAKVNGAEVRFQFRGKSGIEHAVSYRDRRVSGVIKRLQELPGQHLFQYLDEDGVRHSIESGDVNEYLRSIVDADFTAKDFRTWWGTVIAAMALSILGPAETATQMKKNIVDAVKNTAAALGNTPSVCRKCYVHPKILEAYERGETIPLNRRRKGLTAEEAGVLRILQTGSAAS